MAGFSLSPCCTCWLGHLNLFVPASPPSRNVQTGGGRPSRQMLPLCVQKTPGINSGGERFEPRVDPGCRALNMCLNNEAMSLFRPLQNHDPSMFPCMFPWCQGHICKDFPETMLVTCFSGLPQRTFNMYWFSFGVPVNQPHKGYI